jgi:hypothetical protein
MESFFGESQNELRNELSMREFVLYDGATLYAANTSTAFPALFYPGFYDVFYEEVLKQFSHLTNTATSYTNEPQRVYEIAREIARAGLNLTVDIPPYNELFNAFISANYEVISIVTNDAFFHNSPSHRIYALYQENPLGFRDEFLLPAFFERPAKKSQAGKTGNLYRATAWCSAMPKGMKAK